MQAPETIASRLSMNYAKQFPPIRNKVLQKNLCLDIEKGV